MAQIHGRSSWTSLFFPSLRVIFYYVGHRSPPLHAPRERESRSNLPQVAPSSQVNSTPVTASGRTKTRFDQPARTTVIPAPASNASRMEDDVYIPDDIARRDRERPRERARERPELTSSQVDGELHQHEGKRRRISDDNHRSSQSYPEPSFIPNERSISGSTSGTSPSPADASQPRASSFLGAFIILTPFSVPKRAPLPPQSARFQESQKPSGRAVESRLPTQQPRSTNIVDSGVPPGPRQPSQHQPDLREANQSSEARGQRLPPSGPSGGQAGGRRRHDSGFNSNHAVRNAIESNPPRPSSIITNDVPIRTSSGMYADKVENNSNATSPADAAPRGPRAMSNKNGPPHGTSPKHSLNTLMYPQRGQDPQGGRARDRSPPPHLAGNNGLQPREGAVSRFSQNDLSRSTSNADSHVEFRNHGSREVEGRGQVCFVC